MRFNYKRNYPILLGIFYLIDLLAIMYLFFTLEETNLPIVIDPDGSLSNFSQLNILIQNHSYPTLGIIVITQTIIFILIGAHLIYESKIETLRSGLEYGFFAPIVYWFIISITTNYGIRSIKNPILFQIALNRFIIGLMVGIFAIFLRGYILKWLNNNLKNRKIYEAQLKYENETFHRQQVINWEQQRIIEDLKVDYKNEIILIIKPLLVQILPNEEFFVNRMIEVIQKKSDYRYNLVSKSEYIREVVEDYILEFPDDYEYIELKDSIRKLKA